MKIFEKRNTSEVKSKRRRFFAFCLVLIMSMLPAATVFASNIDLGENSGRTVDHTNDTVNEGDVFVYRSGYIYVTYSYPNDNESFSGRIAGEYRVQSMTSQDGTTYSRWKIQNQAYDAEDRPSSCSLDLVPYSEPEQRDQPDNPVTPTPSPSQDDPKKEDSKKEDSKNDTGSSGKKKYSQSPTSWEGNPDEITAFYFKNGVMDPKAKFGKQEQGAACKAAFASALPAGYKQAFTFSMSVDGRHTTDLKDGIIKMYVPSSFQKAGRQFAIMAIDKNAIVHIYNDSDPQASVIASQLNFEGYAFCLIYKD